MTTFSWALCLFLMALPLDMHSESKQKPPDASQFSILGVTVGEDNLATLQSKLGPVKKCRAKEHDGVEIAGYVAATENIIFEFGEVGGGDVTAFSLSLPSQRFGCPMSQLSPQSSGLTTKGGVHLGMTEDEF